MAKRVKTGGRKKGTPNKITAALKDMILDATELAGNDLSHDGKGGTVNYLRKQAVLNPGPYMSLLGKVLPTQLTGDAENPVHLKHDSDNAFGTVATALEGAAKGKAGSSSS